MGGWKPKEKKGGGERRSEHVMRAAVRGMREKGGDDDRCEQSDAVMREAVLRMCTCVVERMRSESRCGRAMTRPGGCSLRRRSARHGRVERDGTHVTEEEEEVVQKQKVATPHPGARHWRRRQQTGATRKT